jgi:uncharacterized membrane protein YkvA (DUF1232 family)
MPEKSRQIVVGGGGFFRTLSNQVRLIARLVADRRVSPLVKILPIASVVYMFIPADILPLLPFDDAAVIWLANSLFIEMCPQDVVEEHRRAIEGEPGIQVVSEKPKPEDETIIDAEFRDEGPLNS